MDLYYQTGGDRTWVRTDRWNFLGGNSTDACLQSWYGLFCVEFHVVGMYAAFPDALRRGVAGEVLISACLSV